MSPVHETEVSQGQMAEIDNAATAGVISTLNSYQISPSPGVSSTPRRNAEDPLEGKDFAGWTPPSQPSAMATTDDASPANYETALQNAGHGTFQYVFMGAVGLFYVASAIETLCVSYLLPSAHCDLEMTSSDEGLLNSSPFIGSLVGAFVWGKLADYWGRRSVLVTAFVIDGIAALLSSLMQTFWPFLFFRLVTGFANVAALPVCYPYLGEMHSSKYRSRALCWTEIFWGVGTVLIPLVAWGIIPRPWILGSHEIGFRYNSWRIFIAACSIPSFAAALAVWCFPESPAFLLTKGRHDDALDVFQRMYHMNTGRPKSSYPIKQLEMISSLELVEVSGCEEKVEKEEEKVEKEEGKMTQMLAMMNQMADIFRPPLLMNTVIGMCSLFSLQLGYFGFGMWFPELFNRFEEFTLAHPNETPTLCEVANMEVDPPEWNSTRECAGDEIQPRVFINTLSIGSASMLCATLNGLFVERIGRKRVYVTAMLLTASCGAGTYFVRSALQNLLLSCALQAFNASSFSTLMSVIIELFPARLRGLTATILMNVSYLGSITGNLLFALLLDINCAIPVFFSAGVIACSAVMCFFLPNTKNATMS